MPTLQFACDITEADVRAAHACASRHTFYEEAGSRPANLALSLLAVAQSLAVRLQTRLHLMAAGHQDHDTMVMIRNEWNDLMCCVEPWQGKELFDEERFRIVEHMNEAGAASRAYALGQARKFAAGATLPDRP
ncbi:hypothetical protein [Streptomyces microflavus]|uniref:hypothetical protein n=1 Tax=Streptomyces microflavus TaxID=1919 RepID=UPI003661592C